MSDAANGAPQGDPTIGDRIADLPTPVKIGALVGVAWLGWRFLKGRTSSPTTDPGTGVPTDTTGSSPGLAGMVGGASGDGTGLGGAPSTADAATGPWVTKALAALAAAGVSPVLANQTIYGYLNGDPLTSQQTGILNTILGTVGAPPGDVLPIIGTLPPPPVAAPPAKSGPTAAQIQANIVAHYPTLAEINKNRIAHNAKPWTLAQAMAALGGKVRAA